MISLTEGLLQAWCAGLDGFRHAAGDRLAGSGGAAWCIPFKPFTAVKTIKREAKRRPAMFDETVFACRGPCLAAREAEPLGNGLLRGVFGSGDYFVMASMTEKNRLPVAVGSVRSP
ncbi:hypothetical protein LJR009_003759 [Bosea sp. LjRoot9]|uniref:hypothetical protein n=1 Tax=Bosea sp. LjRoot9 TaxID=3342341 RepID=UPI003ECF9975